MYYSSILLFFSILESNPSAALNLVKQQQSAQQQPKQLILVAPSPRPSIESIVSSNGDHHGGSRHSKFKKLFKKVQKLTF